MVNTDYVQGTYFLLINAAYFWKPREPAIKWKMTDTAITTAAIKQQRLLGRWIEDMSFLTCFYTYASYSCGVAILFLQEISHWTEDTHMYHHL